MFPGMFDPEMMKMAQEQIKRMKPEDLQRMQQQFFANPDIMKQAAGLRPEDVKFAAEQMKKLSPEELEDLAKQVKNSSPEELEGMGAAGSQRIEQITQYEYQAALALKNQGNQLHNSGKYDEACEKYARAKENLRSHGGSKSQELRRTCSLNLMSCYLKTKQFNMAVVEGSEVLKRDSSNLKAVYRRGQAYKELGKWKLALGDLRKAADLAPDDETVNETYRQLRAELEAKGVDTSGKEGSVEDLDGEDEEDGEVGAIPGLLNDLETTTASSADGFASASLRASSKNMSEDATLADVRTPGAAGMVLPDDTTMREAVDTLSKNPDMIKNMHSMMSNIDPATVASMSGGGMTPQMASMAAEMVKKMKPEDLENMVKMATSMGLGPRMPPPSSGASPSSPPLSSRDRAATAPIDAGQTEEVSTVGRGLGMPEFGMPRDDARPVSASGGGAPMMPEMPAGMMSMMREKLRDPESMKMMTEMMKSMDPEAMASMSSQMGVQMTADQARDAQKMMDSVMLWASRANGVADRVEGVKNWLFSRPLLLLSILVLILAMVLHWFGFIGS